MVPQSCMLKDPPSIATKGPITSRGSCDVYEGFLGDIRVSVKRLRIYSRDEQGKAKRVRSLQSRSFPFVSDGIRRLSAKKLSCGDAWTTQTSFPFWVPPPLPSSLFPFG